MRLLDAPFKPKINNEVDLSNIDRVFTREMPRETPEDSSLLRKVKFDDFTYLDENSLLTSEQKNMEIDENRCTSFIPSIDDNYMKKAK